jgi:hypothetical protein
MRIVHEDLSPVIASEAKQSKGTSGALGGWIASSLRSSQ